MVRKLKVFRTAIGFHDAYVAAPSKKAALEAWGAKNDLFAIDAAEQITDAALMASALERPGEVIKLSRGSIGDHLRAAGNSVRQPPNKVVDTAKPAPRQRKPKPPPSRRTLELAEEEMAKFERAAQSDLARLLEREKQIAQERAATEARIQKDRDRIEKGLAKARRDHDSALERWRRSS